MLALGMAHVNEKRPGRHIPYLHTDHTLDMALR